MTDTLHYTLAVWSINRHGSWHALVTSPRRDFVEALHGQFAQLVWWPSAIVEVPRGTDDDVEAACRALRRPTGWEAADVADRLLESKEWRATADLIHPPGDPNA